MAGVGAPRHYPTFPRRSASRRVADLGAEPPPEALEEVFDRSAT